MPEFEKRKKSREEPPGLTSFAARAAVTPVLVVTDETTPSPEGPPKRPKRGGDGLSMNVRFTPAEKHALERLAAHEERSQQAILMRLVGPLLLEAASHLP